MVRILLDKLKHIGFVFLIAMMASASIDVGATHLAGGTLTYECTGNPNEFKFTILWYRDCTGAGLPASFTMTARPRGGGGNISITMTRVNTDTLPNNAALNPCQQLIGSLCIERHTYESSPVTLPASTGGYDLSYNSCCRNGAVTNLTNPGSQNQVSWMRFPDPGKFPCDNSPTFNVAPPLEVCVNEEFVSDNSITDVDGGVDPSTGTILSGPSHGTASFDPATGKLLYIADSNFSGIDTVRYIVCDDHVPVECDTGIVYIRVSLPNVPPFCGDDEGAVQMGGNKNLTVIANDSDQDGNLDINSFNLITPPSNGTFSFSPPGTISYLPNAGFIGNDTLQYTMCDLGVPPLCDTGNVVFYVRSGTLPPSAWNDYDSVANTGSLTVNVILNDRQNNTVVNPGSLAIVSGPSNGSANLSGLQDITYTPNAGFVGVDTVLYQICDISVPPLCDTAVFRIVVTPSNGIPWVKDDRFAMYDISFKDFPVLMNDFDPDGMLDENTMTILTNPTNGTASPNGANVTYTPTVGFLGVDSFEYKICDNGTPQHCDSAWVYVTIQDGANIPPLAFIDTGGTTAGDSVNLLLYANDYDPDKDSMVFYLCDALEGTAYTGSNVPPFASANYVPGASGTNPIPNSSPPLNLNSQTGVLRGWPTQQGIYVVKVCIDMYRDGKYIGTTSREQEINVVNCFTNTNAGIEPTDPSVPGVIQDCGDTTVHFINASIGSSEYFWNFGDPTTTSDTSSLLDPYWTYPDTGVYTVMLIANPSWPCADTTTAEVRIFPGVIADFGHTIPTCVGNPISYLDSSVALSGSVNAWFWDFGDGGTSNSQDPTHTYNVLGNYSVMLVAESTKGCKDTINQNVLVYNKPVVNAGPNRIICFGDSAQLNATVQAVSYGWKPALGLSCDSCQNPKASPPATTLYTLTALGQGGCIDSSTVLVTVSPPPTLDAGQDVYVCGTQSTQLNATVQNATTGYTVTWNPSSGLNPPIILNPFATPGTTTTYTITINTTNGCVVSDSVTVFVSNLNFDAGPPATICNNDSAQLNASIGDPNYVYRWTPTSTLSDTNSLSPQAFPSTTTLYTLTITDTVANCTDQDTVRVTVSSGPPLGTTGDTSICIGSSTQIQASGGSNFAWDPDPSLSCTNCPDPIVTPANSTTYYVTSSDAAGCTARDSVVVGVDQLPSITTTVDTAICPGTSLNLSASGGSIYAWSPSTTLSCDSCATPLANPTGPITYQVNVTDNNGCTDSAQVNVSIRSRPTVIINPDQVICLKDSVQLSAAGGVAYQWSPVAGLSASNVPDPMASPAVTTMYSVTVTDAVGCTNVDSTEVKVNVLQPGNFIPDTSICIGDNVQLYANGFTTYQWSPVATLSCSNCPTPTANPTATTTYTAVVEDATGCKDTGMVTVTVNPLPTPTLSVPTDSICLNESVQITAGGGVQYSWSPGGSLDCTACPNPTATPTTTTTFSVTITDANGCVGDTSQRITVLPLPTITTSLDTYVCKGDSTSLSVSGGNTYQWNPTGTLTCVNCPNPIAFPKTTTIYTVEAMDVYGCSARDSITISVNTASGNISPDTAICIGERTPLSIGGGISYVWGPGASLSCVNCPNPIASPVNTTTYSVEVTDQNACRDTGYVTVTVNPLPVVGLTADTTVCQGTPVPLRATGGTQYFWSPSQGLSCTSCPVPSALPSSTTRYSVNVTDANGCSDTSSVLITVLPAPPVNAGNDVSICNGDSIQLNASGAATYQWSGGSLTCTNCPDPIAFPTATSEYHLVGTHANGCQRYDTVEVTVNPVPTASVSPTSALLCDGDSVQLTASGGISYQWTPSTDLTCTNCPDPIAFPIVNTSYTVRVSNQFGCWDEAVVQVDVTSPASVDVTPDTGVCPGGSVVLSANGGATYQWSPAIEIVGANTATPTVTPTQPREYTVTITDINNCTVVVPVDVDIYAPADPNAGVPATICFGDSAQLSAQNGTSYSWAPSGRVSDASAQAPMAHPPSTTTYTVSIVDQNGCSNTDRVTINVIPPPNVNAGPDQVIYEGALTFIGATGAQTYSWSPTTYFVDTTGNKILVAPEDTTTFVVLGTDANGCKNVDSMTIFVIPEAQFYIPSGFSPNGDGKNDVFRMYETVNFNVVSLKVFNRWGNLLFESNDVSQGWDGRSPTGEPMPIGTYIYILEAQDDIGKPIMRKGNITLIR